MTIGEGDVSLGDAFHIARRGLPRLWIRADWNQCGNLHTIASHFADEVSEQRKRGDHLDLLLAPGRAAAASRDADEQRGNCEQQPAHRQPVGWPVTQPIHVNFYDSPIRQRGTV